MVNNPSHNTTKGLGIFIENRYRVLLLLRTESGIISSLQTMLRSVVDPDSNWIRIQQLCGSGSLFQIGSGSRNGKWGKKAGLTNKNLMIFS